MKTLQLTFKEQGITIVSILTTVGMAIWLGFLIESLSGCPTLSTTTKSGNSSGGDRKGWGVDKKQIESCITVIR